MGSHPVAVWAIKHIASPVDRFVVRAFRGHVRQPSGFLLPTLLLTVVGRHSGIDRVVPLVFVRDGGSFIVANARPEGERRNPWVSNLRAAGVGYIKHRRKSFPVTSAELTGLDLEVWWPKLVAAWPAFEAHFTATGDRSVFRLDPITEATFPPSNECRID